ncbi:MAG: hypothetical protein M3Z16_07260, partial [Pseudomonadota bacterium]|nr:hypothetical protein [Pseudomonadota bacterium]
MSTAETAGIVAPPDRPKYDMARASKSEPDLIEKMHAALAGVFGAGMIAPEKTAAAPRRRKSANTPPT